MSGHSKWSKIKRQKGVSDKKRGQLFTKLAREITLAASSGSDPDKNFKLKVAIDKAKTANMPKSNIENAIDRAAGKKEKGGNFERILYEGFGPEGISVIVETLTNNRNRTVSDLKRFFFRAGGSLGEKGAVSYLFELKGFLALRKNEELVEEIILKAIDAGAKEVKEVEDFIKVETDPSDLERISRFFEKEGFKIVSRSQEMVPKTVVSIDDKEKARKVLQFVESLEELDDVQQVYTNFDIEDKLLNGK